MFAPLKFRIPPLPPPPCILAKSAIALTELLSYSLIIVWPVEPSVSPGRAVQEGTADVVDTLGHLLT